MRKGKTIRRKGGKLINYIQFEFNFIITMVLRLLAACIMGGIIGFQREYPGHRPAGLRTHILVCLGLTRYVTRSISALYGDRLMLPYWCSGCKRNWFLGRAIIKQGFNVTGLQQQQAFGLGVLGLLADAFIPLFRHVLIYIVLQT